MTSVLRVVPVRLAVAGMLLVVMAGLAFVVTGENWVTRLDLDIVEAMSADRTAAIGVVARGVTWLGNVLLLGGLAAVAAFVLRRVGASWAMALLPAAGVAAAAILDPLAKLAVGRPRPPLELAEVVETATGYPSGHSAQAAACWFALAFAISLGSRGRRRALALASVIVVCVGVSRVVLGVHSPTDVIGGWCLGGAIALVAIEVASVLDARRSATTAPEPGPRSSPVPGR